ncbi:nitrous oxide-stimulated promoter family protein [Paenibacillus puldeungensis]|uniref:Nitrous oxide-stimulated promoter family protein n=1 Tax=Paenibacillus puldeungensis TaxID=696536 RepID=A0ABW3S536_9BACL
MDVLRSEDRTESLTGAVKTPPGHLQNELGSCGIGQVGETTKEQGHSPRIRREKATVALMISLYCSHQHKNRVRTSLVAPDTGLKLSLSLCEECLKLYTYANQRLTHCRFGEDKSTCLSCPVHCYAASQRENIRKVMRYAGPRMLWRYPLLTLQHWLDGRQRFKSQ